MVYYPINTALPGLHQQLLAASTGGSVYPQLPYIPAESAQVYATALVYSPLFTLGPENIAIYLNANYSRPSGVDFRHLGTAVDVELYLDSYSFAGEPLVGLPYPPADPLNLPWEGSYTRSTTGYVYAGIPVPAASDLVWDGRWSLVLDSGGKVVSAADRVGPLIAKVAGILAESDRPPSFTVPLGGLATTSRLPDNVSDYSVKLNRFLERHYRAIGIPPMPSGIAVGDLLVTLDFPPDELLPIGIGGALVPADTTVGLAPNFTKKVGATTTVAYRTTYKVSDLFPELSALSTLPATGDTALGSSVGSFTGDYAVALPPGLIGDIAAIVDTDYFQEWVFWVRKDETYIAGGGLPNVPVLPASS
jgi:hypothetical protein